MVLSYWEMAASLVTTNAINSEAFLAAHNEIVATFSKIEPFLPELRALTEEPEFCRHMERVVMATPDAEATLRRRRKAIRAAAPSKRQET